MEWTENGIRLEIMQGDLTIQKVDAIVNAANSMLDHGGGLAGMISRRGGPVIDRESRAWIHEYGSVSHTNPAYTHAGNLPCKYVIHAVGPIWRDGAEAEKLSTCTAACLSLADKLEISSIAFPAISTGIFGVPHQIAAEGMLSSIWHYIKSQHSGSVKEIRVVLYEEEALTVFTTTQKRLAGEG